MGIPKPSRSFTIPSLHDELPLDCRIYHPPDLNSSRAWKRAAVIIAHPYASLGGSYDVPVIHAVTAALLRDGMTVGTFNFRGALGSRGRTTWTGKGETVDYESFAGLLSFYLDSLNAPVEKRGRRARASPSPQGTTLPESCDLSASNAEQVPLRIVFGGYSYGAMIVRRLPDIDQILDRFSNPRAGRLESIIMTKAQSLAEETQLECYQVTETYHSPSVRIGQASSLRRSHDSRRSAEPLSEIPKKLRAMGRKSTDPTTSTTEEGNESALTDMPNAQPYYLLISPPLPPVSSLIMFGSAPTAPAWTKNHSFAIFGDCDSFSSFKKLYSWTQKCAAETDSMFQFAVVLSAGHFWIEDGVEKKMTNAIVQWLRSRVSSERCQATKKCSLQMLSADCVQK